MVAIMITLIAVFIVSVVHIRIPYCYVCMYTHSYILSYVNSPFPVNNK